MMKIIDVSSFKSGLPLFPRVRATAPLESSNKSKL